MASLFSSPQQATAAAVRSTMQAAAAATGRVRSSSTARPFRSMCPLGNSRIAAVGETAFATTVNLFAPFASSQELPIPKRAKGLK